MIDALASQLPTPTTWELVGMLLLCVVGVIEPRSVFLFLGLAVVAALFGVGHARAASMEYCELYSREYVRGLVAGLDPVDRYTATSDTLRFTLQQSYARCLNQDDEPVLVLPPDASFVDAVVASVHQAPEPTVEDLPLLIDKAGLGEADPKGTMGPVIVPIVDQPATSNTVAVVDVTAVGESSFAPRTTGWNKWCASNYRTFRKSDGTVKRRGHRSRSLCPG